MAQPTHTKGTKLMIGDGASPEQFVHVKGATAIPPVAQEKPEIDVTTLDSQAREYIAGLAVGSDLEFEMIWDAGDPGQQAAQAAYEADRRANWRIDAPDGTRLSFEAVVRSFGLGFGLDDAMKVALSIKISGDVAFSAYTL